MMQIGTTRSLAPSRREFRRGAQACATVLMLPCSGPVAGRFITAATAVADAAGRCRTTRHRRRVEMVRASNDLNPASR